MPSKPNGNPAGEVVELLKKSWGAPSPENESPTTEWQLGRPTREHADRGIPASERTREKVTAPIDGRGEVADGRSELVRLAARLMVEEEALEGEARRVRTRLLHAARGGAQRVATASAPGG
jgi:hypothetical protein